MSAMSRQYVLELECNVKNLSPQHPKKQLIIVDEGSISELSKLKEDLKNFTNEYFIIQYLDEENDLVSIGTEEEFKEFTKLVMQRSSKGEVQKIFLSCNPTTVSESKPPTKPKPEKSRPTTVFVPKDIEKAKQQFTAFALRECYKRIYKGGVIKEWQIKYKNELKQEILSEMKEELGAAFQPNVSRKEIDDYEEDSDGNIVCRHEKKKMKFNHSFKKLDKKEKEVEKRKITQRIEKLESKKKKLVEKANLLRAAAYELTAESLLESPSIMSGMEAKESVILSHEVVPGRLFIHLWRIINDGTVAWNDVQLQHTWSTPGLHPKFLKVKCPPLDPGVEGIIRVVFRAPITTGPFVSYWHFVHGPQSMQFGHYLSVTGTTKPSNCASGSGELSVEQEDQEMTDKKKVSFNDKAAALDENSYTDDEMTLKKHIDASLASSEIAAEMVREAAKAALRVTSGMQTDKPDNKDELLSELDQVIKNYQELHLEGSESDTEVNIDVNEDVDPGFVIVDIPRLSTEQKKPKAMKTLTLSWNLGKEEKEKNLLQNQKDGDILTPTKVVGDIKKERDDVTTSTVTNKKPVGAKETVEVAQEVSEPPPPFDPATMSYNLNLNNNGSNFQKYLAKLPEDQQALQMGYSRVDPHISYPHANRVPMPIYQPQQHHIYPMFAPQNSSSHSIVFPSPPMNYIGLPAPPKINPPHFPPFPNAMSSSDINIRNVPFPSSTFQPPMTQKLPHDVLGCGGSSDNTIQQTVRFRVPFIFKQKVSKPSSTPNNETIKTDEDKKKTNQEILIEKTIPDLKDTTSVTTENSHVPMRGGSIGDEAVQILPQGLVDGAVNVASTAYSHAWNALNNLLPKESEVQEFDAVFENNMAVLYDMGFINAERNAMLLKRFNNDLTEVISVICAFGGDGIKID